MSSSPHACIIIISDDEGGDMVVNLPTRTRNSRSPTKSHQKNQEQEVPTT
jgi:hypothetical protein